MLAHANVACKRSRLRCVNGNRSVLPSRQHLRVCAAGFKPGDSVDKGLSVLEWTGKLVPQGALVLGVKESWKLAWTTLVKELAPQDKSGAYKRPQYAFSGRIGSAEFPVESGRYHVYVGNACPWCHRVLLVLALRGLAGHVSYSRLVADPTRARRGGWVFDTKTAPDPVFGAADLWQVYDTAQPGFRGRCTAPLLVDKKTKRIVSNESADIVRMLNDIQLPGALDVDLYPQHLARDIAALCDRIYNAINNGVYRSGFSTTQAAYDAVQSELWSALDECEARLGKSRFLLGDRFTAADLWLLPTIARMDAVYAGIFKCGRRSVRSDYPAIMAWLRDCMQLQLPPGGLQVADTIDIDAARVSYYTSLFPVNPGGIVASGPTAKDLQLMEVPAGRGASSSWRDCLHPAAGAAAAGASS